MRNILGKRENAGYHHFFLFPPTMFSKGFFHRVVKSQDWERVNFPVTIVLPAANTFNFDQAKIQIRVNPFPHNNTF